jgi:purine-cytosine permease-like protein
MRRNARNSAPRFPIVATLVIVGLLMTLVTAFGSQAISGGPH